ncbi:MAG TPA: hypothetical protein VGG39_19600 [Polyangiaceae bacterium]
MSTGALRAVAVLAVLVAAGAIVAAVVASGRAPSLNRALSGVASAVSSAVALPDDGGPDEAAASDGGAASADGGRTDAGPRRKRQAAPLSSAQLGAPLVDGHYLAACGAPDTMKVTVKLTVKLGKATAVDVDTDPPDTKVARCVQDFVEGQRWDLSPKTGKFTIRY